MGGPVTTPLETGLNEALQKHGPPTIALLKILR
jgi:hypothetical protein